MNAPLPSTDLNYIFYWGAQWDSFLDQTFDSSDNLSVNDVYHTTAYDHGLHVSAFAVTPGGGGVYTGSLWTFASAGTITAPLPFLIPGDLITTIEHDWTRGAGNVTVSLVRRAITVGGGVTVVQSNVDSTSSVELNTTNTYNHTVLAGNLYYMSIGYSAPSGASTFAGSLVKCTRPHP